MLTINVTTTIKENQNIFKGFVNYIGYRTGIQFYVPKNNISKYELYLHHIVLTDSTIKQIPKIDDRFNYTKNCKESKYKDFYNVTFCPHDLSLLDIKTFTTKANITKYIILEANIPVCVLTANSEGVTSAEFYDIPTYTSLYRNISNVFIDTASIHRLDDNHNMAVQIQCVQLVRGELFKVEVPLYLMPVSTFNNKQARISIIKELKQSILNDNVDQAPYIR